MRVQRPLQIRQRYSNRHVVLLWQARHLGLHPPQDLRRDEPTEFLNTGGVLSCGLTWSPIALAKVVQGTEQTSLHEIEKTPQVRETILHRRSGTCNLQYHVLLFPTPSDHRILLLY